MDLTSRLASTVHDVKNKLQLISSVVEQLSGSADQKVRETGNDIQRGLMDVNEELVALLGLYRLDQNKIVSGQEVFVADLLSACITYKPSNLDATIECDPDLVGYFDENLVRSVVSDAFHNSIKFARSRILLKAARETGGVVISVEDDGPGFAATATGISEGTDKESMADRRGTGLGLYFAEQVAKAHRNKGNPGWIKSQSSDGLGGAAFSIYLP